VTELPIQRVLLDGIAEIERLGVTYAVMGGFAARAWGLPRPTFDADIAIAADSDSLPRLYTALESAGFDVPPEHKTGFLDTIGGFQKARVNRFVDGHVWSTDLFVARGAFMTSALARARDAEIGGTSVRVMAPEDIILLKLIAHRRKDLADIEEMIAVCTSLDVDYLRDWAKKLDIEEAAAEFFPHAS
jgi:hypothetical protein